MDKKQLKSYIVYLKKEELVPLLDEEDKATVNIKNLKEELQKIENDPGRVIEQGITDVILQWMNYRNRIMRRRRKVEDEIQKNERALGEDNQVRTALFLDDEYEMGMRRKPKVKIPVEKPGSLTSLGYAIHDNQVKRHRALTKAVNKYGFQPVMAKVNTLYVYNMRKHPDIAKKAASDKNWLHKKYYKERSPKRSPRGSPKRSPKRLRKSVRAPRKRL